MDESCFYEAFQFDDSTTLADELGKLVLSGTQRSTTASGWSFEASGKRLAPGTQNSILKQAGLK